jgi:ABC-type Fe3+-hydroxamate transport system substrate-binding protein
VALIVLAACTVSEPLGIVSLHDTTTEIVVGLGKADALVAIMEPEFLSPAALAAVDGVPRVSAPVSAEALVALHPAVVVGTKDVPEHQPELTNVPGATWIDPVGLEGLWRSIATVGIAIGAPSEAYITALKARVPEPVTGELPVFVYDCCEPPFTMGGRAPLSELLGRLGARNVFTDLDQDWGRVSWEAAMVTEPRLVIVSDYDGEGDAAGKIEVVHQRLGEVPTVVLPLGLALEGPRTLDAPDVLRPAIQAASVLASTEAAP